MVSLKVCPRSKPPNANPPLTAAASTAAALMPAYGLRLATKALELERNRATIRIAPPTRPTRNSPPRSRSCARRPKIPVTPATTTGMVPISAKPGLVLNQPARLFRAPMPVMLPRAAANEAHSGCMMFMARAGDTATMKTKTTLSPNPMPGCSPRLKKT